MSNNYSSSGSRRSSRGGSRRPHRGDRPSIRDRQETKPKKKSLVEKIIGFFGGSSASSKPATRSHAGSSSGSDTLPRKRERTGSSRPTGMRTPEMVEVTSPRLYVGNLSFDAGESDLFELFNGVGLVQNVEVVMNRHTMRSKGFAFVQMQTVDEAKRAVTELHDKDYMGRKLVVSGAKAIEERRSERTRPPE